MILLSSVMAGGSIDIIFYDQCLEQLPIMQSNSQTFEQQSDTLSEC